jgi:hypothetical protein
MKLLSSVCAKPQRHVGNPLGASMKELVDRLLASSEYGPHETTTGMEITTHVSVGWFNIASSSSK